MQHDIEVFDTLECVLLRLHGGFMVLTLLLVILPSKIIAQCVIINFFRNTHEKSLRDDG
jgi:hypothetical protein